jgi:hypothetical protein
MKPALLLQEIKKALNITKICFILTTLCITQILNASELSLNTSKHYLLFDGVNNYLRGGNSNTLGNRFTIQAWIKPEGSNHNNSEKTIVAKKSLVDGYSLILQNNNKVKMEWIGTDNSVVELVTNTPLPNNKWHHIAIVFDSRNLSIYIDGVLDISARVSVPKANTSEFSIGATYANKIITKPFKGGIDEVLVWNTNLSVNQIRYLMNQEIYKISTNVISGKSIPVTITKNELSTLQWSQLLSYFSMNLFNENDVLDESNSGIIGKGDYSIEIQSAPLPYVTIAHGEWSNQFVWHSGSEIKLPCEPSLVNPAITIDWNIVFQNRNIISLGNKTLLGLIINNNTLTVENDSKIEITHYLKNSGKLDLEGKSQLIQQLNCDLELFSNGMLERDQQGTTNRFNYNYWSSPVSTMNNTSINHGFTVNSILRDGANPASPQPINWTTSVNNPTTSPITLSSYWIFKFQNLSPIYANWSGVGQNGHLAAGQGFTMKGSNQATGNQNYVFVGKPNNGLITSPIAPNNLNLSGNPYPSALDVNEFILNNLDSTTGTVYLWEHYATNNTHNLAGYQGGYATRNLVGGTEPIAPEGISNLGSSDRIPGRFLPVGQGFMVYGNETGGLIKFNNNQRAFVKENNSQSGTIFRQISETNAGSIPDYFSKNDDNNYAASPFQKIRLNVVLPNQHKRQLLIGYMNEYATDNFDKGFDAPIIDNYANDAYFILANYELNILGDSYFSPTKSHTIGVKSTVAGTIKFELDSLENIPNGLTVYIYDQLTNTYHNIIDGTFETTIGIEQSPNRFYLRYQQEGALNNNDLNAANHLDVLHNSFNSTIQISNEYTLDIKKVSLVNILGQVIQQWNTNSNVTLIELSTQGVMPGTYVVTINSDEGTTSKKIIIQ